MLNYNGSQPECWAVVLKVLLLPPYSEGHGFTPYAYNYRLNWVINLADCTGKLPRWWALRSNHWRRLRLSEIKLDFVQRTDIDSWGDDTLSWLETGATDTIGGGNGLPPMRRSLRKKKRKSSNMINTETWTSFSFFTNFITVLTLQTAQYWIKQHPMQQRQTMQLKKLQRWMRFKHMLQIENSKPLHIPSYFWSGRLCKNNTVS